MTYHRLAYDDAATTAEMVSDARLAEDALPVPAQVVPAPDTDPRDAALPMQPVVSEDLARMAAGLELHFD